MGKIITCFSAVCHLTVVTVVTHRGLVMLVYITSEQKFHFQPCNEKL